MDLLLSSCGVVWAEEKSNQNRWEGSRVFGTCLLETHVSAAQWQTCASSARRAQERGQASFLCLPTEPLFCNCKIWYFIFFQNMNSEIARAASSKGKPGSAPQTSLSGVFVLNGGKMLAIKFYTKVSVGFGPQSALLLLFLHAQVYVVPLQGWTGLFYIHSPPSLVLCGGDRSYSTCKQA